VGDAESGLIRLSFNPNFVSSSGARRSPPTPDCCCPASWTSALVYAR
jgi:hypothetical protein